MVSLLGILYFQKWDCCLKKVSEVGVGKEMACLYSASSCD